METRTLAARLGYRLNYGLGIGIGLGAGAALLVAGARSAQAGESKTDQAKAVAKEGVKQGVGLAAFTVGTGAALWGISKVAGATAAKVAGTGLLPAFAAVGGTVEAIQAAREGKSRNEVAKAFGHGALNAVVPVDAIKEGAQAAKQWLGTKTPSQMPTMRQAAQAVDWNQQGAARNAPGQDFAAANAHFQQSHMVDGNPTDSNGEGQRGFANPKVQKAAQKARGVQNVTSWAADAPDAKAP